MISLYPEGTQNTNQTEQKEGIRMTRRLISIALILLMTFTMTAVPASASSRSPLHSLKVRQDAGDQRILYISWENEEDIECKLTITRVESNGKAVNHLLVDEYIQNEDNAYVFDQALPITTYRISVYQLYSGEMISKTISLGKAPDYTDYGAQCHGGTMYFVDRDDLDSGMDPWENGVNRRKFTQMSVHEFSRMMMDYECYGMSDFTYRRSSYDHEVEILYILRGPAGNDVFRTERKTLEGGPSNWRWNWYYPLEDMIWEMSGNSYLVDPGSYMFEVYFNDCRVSRKEFVLTR